MFGKTKMEGSRTGGRSRPCTTGWQAPWDMVTPVTIRKKAMISPTRPVTPVIRLSDHGHARDRGRDGHCTQNSFSSRPWFSMYECVLHFPWIITPVMAPSRCPSPITPVIHMEEDEEHSITPVTMKNWACSDHHGDSSRPWPTQGWWFIFIMPVQT